MAMDFRQSVPPQAAQAHPIDTIHPPRCQTPACIRTQLCTAGSAPQAGDTTPKSIVRDVNPRKGVHGSV
jgi:hypothetical protein